MSKTDDFPKIAKERYDDLTRQEEGLKKQIVEIQSEKRALKPYLIEKGIFEKKNRKSKKRLQPASSQQSIL